ncbi:glycosyltransferase [Olleya aquimaris]|uniref:Glycosyltransferase n=1 Tax=Olleya sediminilitoris TaxID=2795739 RepID=A0ABS1WM56_9FLAO|nr:MULTISPECIES: glycosyltransferase [Olleya]AXO80413.1 glycosyltransferase [Olleya aquimaris]MBL7560197.1 glycosyltransferase [Olleya sediminilitoris]
MKIGVIIIFHNNENDIDTDCFIQQIQKTPNLELCLVNNNSKDNTYKILDQIKQCCNNVSVVNINKFKSDVSAVRAGARFMASQHDLEHLGYATANLLNKNEHGLNGLIKAISKNQDLILDFNIENLKKRDIKLTLFKSLFSIIDYLKKLNVNDQFVNLQSLSKL